ncbi:VC2662 family protein [Paraferrimonas haliotis]|uniref:PhaC PHA synthase n=1 Tax=Paraferrimonas haliotis TaxID=2013866 RepID=A0AA37WXU1_9GAMM|nr:phaC PHA synthase [Paraferrimonas haliotis]GLS83015.1 hypothetical protein GCM10007894_09920 [Paraferrimonas haliotis]
MKKALPMLALAAAIASPVALADSTPVMFSSVNGFNAPDADRVGGVRLAALHGKVNEVNGLDIAVIGMSETNRTKGVNIGFFGANKVNQEFVGASFGLFNWHTGLTKGANIGAVNIANDVHGANVSWVNYSKGHTMVDVGAVSISETSDVQVGIFNKTKKIDKFQIGIINCADNGFFPCFPIINFAK